MKVTPPGRSRPQGILMLPLPARQILVVENLGGIVVAVVGRCIYVMCV
jgi:hypothetical protein